MPNSTTIETKLSAEEIESRLKTLTENPVLIGNMRNKHLIQFDAFHCKSLKHGFLIVANKNVSGLKPILKGTVNEKSTCTEIRLNLLMSERNILNFGIVVLFLFALVMINILGFGFIDSFLENSLFGDNIEQETTKVFHFFSVLVTSIFVVMYSIIAFKYLDAIDNFKEILIAMFEAKEI